MYRIISITATLTHVRGCAHAQLNYLSNIFTFSKLTSFIHILLLHIARNQSFITFYVNIRPHFSLKKSMYKCKNEIIE